jgi:hypothetical protein
MERITIFPRDSRNESNMQQVRSYQETKILKKILGDEIQSHDRRNTTEHKRLLHFLEISRFD